jgi:transcriptional regulator with XRE-family HTH domain
MSVQVLRVPAFHGAFSMKGFPMSVTKIAGNGAISMPGLCRWLHAAFPASTSKQVESATGIAASSVEKWLRGETRPSGDHLTMMVSVFGPSFTAAAMPGAAWLKEAARDADIRAKVTELFGLLAAA